MNIEQAEHYTGIISKMSEEELTALAGKLCAMIESVEAATTRLKTRWDVIDAYYNNVPTMATSRGKLETYDDGDYVYQESVTSDVETSIHYPLIQPIIDQVVAETVSGIVAQPYYCTPTIYGSNGAKSTELSKAIQFLAEQAGITETLYSLALNAALYGVSWVKVDADVTAKGFLPNRHVPGFVGSNEFAFAGVTLEAIDPANMYVYPVEVADTSSSRMIGHRWGMFHESEVDEMVAAGRLWKPKSPARSHPDVPDYRQRNPYDSLHSPLFSTVEDGYYYDLYTGQVRVKLGDSEVWCDFVLDRDGRQLLLLRPYVYSAPNYVMFSFDNLGSKAYPQKSIAGSIQHIQTAVNDFFQSFMDGSASSVMPMTAMTDDVLEDGDMLSFEPGKFIRVHSGAAQNSLFPIYSNFNGQYVMAAINTLESKAYELAKVTANNVGSQFQGNITATEASQIARSAQVRLSGLTLLFGGCLAKLYSVIQHVAGSWLDMILDAFGDQFPLQGEDAQLLYAVSKWDVTGKHVSQTPEAKLQSAMVLYKTNLEWMGMFGGALPVPFDWLRVTAELANNSGLSATDLLLNPQFAEWTMSPVTPQPALPEEMQTEATA